ncbi:MAG: 50S ribosomal protein L5 [Puniceicoccales bacterium]|jgi:large subunit ribosomal protein L5|nr:50S ribosomal protein L5 [Puniceicoccales bacterium]
MVMVIKTKSTLKDLYLRSVVPELEKVRGYRNRHDVPKLEKIVVNSAISSSCDKSYIEDLTRDIGLITGQKPVVIAAKKSISNFKLRKGMPNGVKATLRGNVMYDFFLRFTCIALPIVRDFRGVSSKMDGRGNYTIGVTDHTIFPEISVDREKKTIGMDISFITTAKTDDEGRDLLQMLGMPFKKKIST